MAKKIESALLLRRIKGDNGIWTIRTTEDTVFHNLNFVGKWNDKTKARICEALNFLMVGGTFPEGQVFTYHGNKPAISIVEGKAVVVAS